MLVVDGGGRKEVEISVQVSRKFASVWAHQNALTLPWALDEYNT